MERLEGDFKLDGQTYADIINHLDKVIASRESNVRFLSGDNIANWNLVTSGLHVAKAAITDLFLKDQRGIK